VLTNSDEQRRAAEDSKARAQQRLASPIATTIEPLEVFYPAEAYHQQYYFKNGHEPYCHVLPVETLRELGLMPASA
jgi:peptide-methionine (S)-S-oxide reductase